MLCGLSLREAPVMNTSPAANGRSFSSKPAPRSSNSKLAALTLAALGVVYGDIGTSPLYAFKEAFGGSHGLPLNQTNVLADRKSTRLNSSHLGISYAVFCLK